MKTLFFLITLSLSTNLFSQEKPKTPPTPMAVNSDACSLKFDRLKPIFDPDSKLYSSMTNPEKDNRLRTLKQGVVLKNGTEIRMIKSGCTHYIYVINIRPSQVQNFEPQYLFELAVENLKLIPTVKDEAFNITLLLNALDKKNYPIVSTEPDLYNLPCVDGAVCSVRILRETGNGSEIEISYDKTL